MTRKHYILIADALRDAFDSVFDGHGVDVAMHKIADALLKDNPNFDRDRFIKRACGQ